MTDQTIDPDWDSPLSLNVTPASLARTLFSSADEIHTAWQSCVDQNLVVAESVAPDLHTANYCRLVEQEYEGQNSEESWHDWCVELRIGDIYIAGHWRLPMNARSSDWFWNNQEAQQAFTIGCVLFGRRVGRTVYVEEPVESNPPPTRH